jgi:hypothetical protein
MSIFNTILQKLGIQKPAAPAATPPAPAAPGQMAPNGPGPQAFKPGQPAPTGVSGPQPTTFAAMPPRPAPMPMVDVVSKLDSLAKASPIQLDWKVSINDLMALLGMDHSPDAIKELAIELGCPEPDLSDSYKRNVWTHKTLLQKIAENGGNIPQNLLH